VPEYARLLAALAAASFGLFFFFVVDPNPRYAHYGVAFTAAIAGPVVALGLAAAARARRAALGAAALVGGLVLWGAANGAVLHRCDELISVARQRRYLVVANDLNRASQDRRCAFSFTGIVPPQLEIAARCEAHAFPRARELPLPVLVRQMNRWARQEARDGVVPFVVWVEVNRLRPEWGHWRLIRRVFGTGLGESAMLVFRPLA